MNEHDMYIRVIYLKLDLIWCIVLRWKFLGGRDSQLQSPSVLPWFSLLESGSVPFQSDGKMGKMDGDAMFTSMIQLA